MGIISSLNCQKKENVENISSYLNSGSTYFYELAKKKIKIIIIIILKTDKKDISIKNLPIFIMGINALSFEN